MKRFGILLLFILAAGIVGGAGYMGFQTQQVQAAPTVQAPATVPVTTCNVSQSVTAPGSLVNTNETSIEMPLTGRLAEINVRPGDSVQKGQVLASLDNQSELEAAISAAKLDLLQTQSALEELYQQAPLQAAQAEVDLLSAQKAADDAQKKRTQLEYPRADQTTIDEALAHLELDEQALNDARDHYDDLSHLPANDPERLMALAALSAAIRQRNASRATYNWYLGTPTDREVAAADAQVTLTQAQLTQAQKALEESQSGPGTLELQLAQAKVDDAQARLDAAEADLAKVKITAPFDGIVLEVKVQAGQTIPANTALIVLNDPQAVEVETTVIEEDLPYVEIGQGAEVYFDALPGEPITGTVSRIVPKRAPGDRPLYYVYIMLDHVPDKLFAGMSADASVTIAERRGVLCLPRALAQAAADGTATLEVWDGSQKSKRIVTIGLRGDTNVEILSGLKEGDLVVAR